MCECCVHHSGRPSGGTSGAWAIGGDVSALVHLSKRKGVGVKLVSFALRLSIPRSQPHRSACETQRSPLLRGTVGRLAVFEAHTCCS